MKINEHKYWHTCESQSQRVNEPISMSNTHGNKLRIVRISQKRNYIHRYTHRLVCHSLNVISANGCSRDTFTVRLRVCVCSQRVSRREWPKAKHLISLSSWTIVASSGQGYFVIINFFSLCFIRICFRLSFFCSFPVTRHNDYYRRALPIPHTNTHKHARASSSPKITIEMKFYFAEWNHRRLPR